MAGTKSLLAWFLLASIITTFHHRGFYIGAACPSIAECDECSTVQTVCRLCPHDPQIPADVIDLTILPGTCPAVNRVGLLRDTLFALYADLERLTLENLGLQTTYGQVFKNNTKLKVLSLANNEFTSIDDQFLQGIPSLEKLDLSNNNLTVIRASEFNGVTIDSLDLSNNPITLIEEGAFTGSTINTLDLSGTQLTSVPKSWEQWLATGQTTIIMEGVNNFECDCDIAWFGLYGSGNGPTCSSSGNYTNMPLFIISVQVLRDCATTMTTPATTSALTTMILLDPSCPAPPECDVCDSLQATCRICPDDPRIPATVESLTIISGTCTVLRHLGLLMNSSFSRYSNLKHINLDDANVERFYGPVFQNNHDLRTLSMANGHIRDFPNGFFDNLNTLEILNLSNNSIMFVIPDQFQGLSSLLSLNLSHNLIPNIGYGVFAGLEQLSILVLDSNPIDKIEGDEFRSLANIKTLSLQNMAMTSIPSKLFANLSVLETLDMSGNKISFIADDSFTGTSLTFLDVSSNELTLVPSSAIQQIKPALNGVTLSNLDISKNKLVVIRSSDFNGVTIDSLDLSDNPITEIEEGAFAGSTINTLDLSNTKLTTVPNSWEQWLETVHPTIIMDQVKDFECTCETVWFGLYLKKTVGSANGPICSYDGAYGGMPFGLIAPQVLQDCTATTTTTTTISNKLTTAPSAGIQQTSSPATNELLLLSIIPFAEIKKYIMKNGIVDRKGDDFDVLSVSLIVQGISFLPQQNGVDKKRWLDKRLEN